MHQATDMIKAIIFDCFGVLYVPHDDRAFRLLADPRFQDDVIRDLAHQSEYGLIDDETLHRGMAEHLGVSVDKVRRDLGEGFLRNQPLLDYIQQLRRSYKVGLLSNLGAESMQKFFSEPEQRELFDAVVVSGRVGMIKPYPEIFEYTCRQLGVDTSEAVMVDDVEGNCAGARAAGLRAIRYETFSQLQSDFVKLQR